MELWSSIEHQSPNGHSDSIFCFLRELSTFLRYQLIFALAEHYDRFRIFDRCYIQDNEGKVS